MNRSSRSRFLRGRRDGLLAALLILATATALLPGLAASARSQPPERLGEFLWGLAGQESGWDYTARNAYSGAYGKYQVMPANWPSWATRYLGDRWADQTPRNQELVVRAKIVGLHRWLGSWRRVAYWWLTGDTQTDERRWSSYARSYVHNVMTLSRRAPPGGDPIPSGPAASRPAAERGDWRLVVHGAVLFDRIAGSARGRIDRLRDGQVLFVQESRTNARGVLWMKVSTRDRKVGWISVRRTVPTGRPAHADRWPRGDRVTDPEPDDRRRDRARPRPR